jgi:ATP-binding cassette subfamily B protein RaxB
MPAGYFAQVGDMGSSLSGGQRQRILLARALYRKPRILFLDEGTANLDLASEAEIIYGIRQLGITIICVAHRAKALEVADEVYELVDGKLVLESNRDSIVSHVGDSVRRHASDHEREPEQRQHSSATSR